MIVFVDQKDKYGDIELAEFAEGAQKKLVKRLGAPKISPPVEFKIGELPAIQFEITGGAGGSTYVYHQTLIQGPRNFYEILMWTPKKELDKNQYMIHEAVNSFKEITS